ncbi:autotransporter outer membrane beta-barrel domain-containing protein [Pelagibacterium montanilacus]|uniref:autotransporter outer membrane beta-barrel domain-containing protein n=1 Tax=Pelagibacterium montanilacus TaxID=2185280 RepID=UPI0013DFCF19|nr:autotransporter domain-containing protein [Pelagibacterium montanilacus]
MTEPGQTIATDSGISNIIVESEGALGIVDVDLDREFAGDLVLVDGGHLSIDGGSFDNQSSASGSNTLAVRDGGTAVGNNTSLTHSGAHSSLGNSGAAVLAASGGSAILNDSIISTTGNWSFGVRASGADSTVSLSGGEVNTIALRAYALFADGEGASIDASDTSIQTQGERGYGAYATSGGQVDLTDVSIETDGFMAYGLYAANSDSVINATNVDITTDGRVGDAVWAYDGGVVNLNGGSIVVNGGPSTGGGGELSNGLVSVDGGIINADGVSITKHGESGWGLLAGATVGGTPVSGAITFSNGSVLTTGEGASVAQVNYDSSLAITGSSLTSQQGYGFSLTDSGSVTLLDTTLASQNSSFSSRFTRANQLQSIIIGSGTVINEASNGLLLEVSRGEGGEDGTVTLTLGTGSTSAGDIVDRDYEEDASFGDVDGEGWTDVILQAGANWIGQAIVRNFFDFSGGDVGFADGSTLGSLQANGSSYTFGDGMQVVSSVNLANGSSTTGGSIGNPISVGGSVTVDGSSTLGGNWSIEGDFTSSGTTSAGNSIGEVYVGGDTTFQSDHVLITELTNEPDNDRLISDGTVTLGGTAVFSILDGVEFGHAYDFLRGNEIDGSFDAVVYDRDYVFLAAPSLLSETDDGDDLRTVTIERKALTIADGAASGNQRAIAEALDGLSADDSDNDNTNAVLNSILVSDSFDAVRASLDGLSGEVHASILGALAHNGPSLAGVAVDRLRHAPDRDTAPVIMSYAPMSGELGQPYGANAGPSIWGHISGTDRSSDAENGIAATDADTVQLLIGAESLLDAGWTVGGFLGYSTTSLDIPDRASTARSEGFQAGVYGGTEWDDFTFRLGASYTGNSVSTTREVLVGLDTQTLEADYGVHGGHVFGEIGHRFYLSGAVLEPFVRLEHTHLSSGSYAESGGDAALAGSGDALNATFATLGAHASTSVDVGNGMIADLEALIGYRHALHVSGSGATHGFEGSEVFAIEGNASQSAVLVGAGVSLDLTEAASVDASYAGEFGENSRSHTLKAGLSVSF